jgi:hypothetical protein
MKKVTLISNGLIENPRYISQPHSYKTHLAILRNGKFWKLACGTPLEQKRGVSMNDYTLDENKVTCIKCQNARKPKEVKTVQFTKPVFWHKWVGGGGWEKTSKSDVTYYLSKSEIAEIMNGEVVQNKNYLYAYGLEKPKD